MKVSMTRKEVEDQEKAQFEAPLLAEEESIPFNVVSCRHATRIVKGVDTLIVNVKMTVAEDHTGVNEPGAVFEKGIFFPLDADGEPDRGDSRFNMNMGQLNRIAFAAFGGKNAANPGRYPVADTLDEHGEPELFVPWVALEQFADDTTQIVMDLSHFIKGEKTYVNLKNIRPRE